MRVGDLVRYKTDYKFQGYTFVIVDKLQFVKYNGGTDKCVMLVVLSEPDDPNKINKNYSVGDTLPWWEENMWEVIECSS